MLRVVKYAVCVKRPVPASGSFKAEERAPREVENCLRLLSFRRKINSVIGQDALHFAKIGFPAVPEVFTDVFGSSSKQHCEDCLTTLKVSWFVDILNIHFSPYMTFACQETQKSISQLYRSENVINISALICVQKSAIVENLSLSSLLHTILYFTRLISRSRFICV